MERLKVVVAPNSFKGSLTSPEAAAAISRGVLHVFSEAEIVEVPLADGGEGTAAALVRARSGHSLEVEVEGPLGDPVKAALGMLDNGVTAVVELAASSGLGLVVPDRRDPARASTYGFGQLLAAAREKGAGRILVGIGGSATNDGGAGMAQALGWRLLDAAGEALPRGGAELARLETIERGTFDPGWGDLDIMVATDVANPLCGPHGASRVYGPQKGADQAMVGQLEDGLSRLATVIRRDLGLEVENLPGAGAAGGTGAGLVAFLGARLVPGAPFILREAGLEAALDGAALVFTGEGRVDGQTVFGKAPVEVVRQASLLGLPTVVLAGSLGDGWEALLQQGAQTVLPIAEGPSTLVAMERDGAALLERAATRACQLLRARLP